MASRSLKQEWTLALRRLELDLERTAWMSKEPKPIVVGAGMTDLEPIVHELRVRVGERTNDLVYVAHVLFRGLTPELSRPTQWVRLE